jgi:low affinity Fe/Cu permease
MENQGKRPDQIKFSEDATYYTLIGIIVILFGVFLIQNFYLY